MCIVNLKSHLYANIFLQPLWSKYSSCAVSHVSGFRLLVLKRNTPGKAFLSQHTCVNASVSLAEGERLKRQERRRVCRVCACRCVRAHSETRCTRSRAQNRRGNRAENCCVTGICLALPLSLVSSSSFPRTTLVYF